MTHIPDEAVHDRKRPEISPLILREIFLYDKKTGFLYHKVRGSHLFRSSRTRTSSANAKWWNGRFAGTRACKPDCRNGYLRVGVFGKEYPAHRVIWAMVNGGWPSMSLDHIDGDKENNTMENLREATQSQNNMNRKGFGKSKYKGVSWRKSQSQWVASIKTDGKQDFLGLFDSEEDAAISYDVAAIEKHGEFAKTNFPRKLYHKADFERRILSCVVTKPVDVAAVRRHAFEEAAKWLDDWSTKTMGQDVSPDYASPAPCQDLKAENERLREALTTSQKALNSLVSEDSIKNTTVINAYAMCVDAELKARKALKGES